MLISNLVVVNCRDDQIIGYEDKAILSVTLRIGWFYITEHFER
jgi:hypothetical protein